MTTATLSPPTRPAPAPPPPAMPIAPPTDQAIAIAAVAAADGSVADDYKAAGYPSCLLLPLAEFGQSLDSPDLDRWFEGFAGRNHNQGQYEITAQGELKIMPPTGFPGDLQEAQMSYAVVGWSNEHGGFAGGPTTCFVMPDGSRLGPDAWWASSARWHSALSDTHQPTFVAVVPEFIVEIVSPSNRGPELLNKVQRYLAAGVLLIWVINPPRRRVTIYRPNADSEILDDPETLHGESVMPGFTFNVRQRIFDYQ